MPVGQRHPNVEQRLPLLDADRVKGAFKSGRQVVALAIIWKSGEGSSETSGILFALAAFPPGYELTTERRTAFQMPLFLTMVRIGNSMASAI